jgi:23S rRNA U2552 (ribose-2'-O)-methylase RlmE/FtsJ
VSLVERQVVLLPWDTRNEHHHAQEDAKPLCRAYFKLHEALLIPTLLRDSPVSLAWCMKVQGLRVIDVGAAPGGWSQCLLVNIS